MRITGLLGHPSIQSLRVLSLWEEYEARETPESKFVKDLDLFELGVQAVEYENCELDFGTGPRKGADDVVPQRTRSEPFKASSSRLCLGSSTPPSSFGRTSCELLLPAEETLGS